MPTIDTHRIFRITDAFREAFATKRDTTSSTNAKVIAAAVVTELPTLVEALQGLGFSKEEQATRSARWPFSPDTISRLKEASEATGLPQSMLLMIALKSFTSKDDAPETALEPAPVAKTPTKPVAKRKSKTPAPNAKPATSPVSKQKPRQKVSQ